ncbi:MAG: nucleoside 2-deoxyribosyltransferase [Polyangiaceae bacterium]
MSKLAYIAGPLFSQSERDFQERIADICERLEYGTFLPHRDAGLQTHGNAEQIFSADLGALERCDLVVANLDGPDVDAGTAWEIGYAVARGKSIIGVRTDRRCLEPWASVNVMIEQSSYIVTTLHALEGALAAFSRGGINATTPRPAGIT